ncbi:MAG: AsmA family protein [Elusimicrobiaceae bacterium]|nr:AsmA family protein [Elusimicrobiaceae bacterium]
MMRKWMKRIVVFILAGSVCLVLLHFALQALSGSEKVRHLITEKLAVATGRDVRMGNLSLGVNRLLMEEFSLAKEGGFERGTDLHIRHLYLKVSWLHLLRGQVKIVAARIDGLALRVVRDPQGKLNWGVEETENSAEKEDSDSDGKINLPLGLSMGEVSLRNMQLSYTDQVEKLALELQDTDLLVRNFSLEDPFDLRLNTSVRFQSGGKEQVFPLGIALHLKLADLDLSKAEAVIKDLSVRNGSARMHISGQVNNFVDPVFSLKGSGKDLSQQFLEGLVKDPIVFSIPEINLSAQGAVAPEAHMWRVDKTELALQGLKISGEGKGNWAHHTYSFSAVGQATLDEWGKQLALLQPYKLRGQLDAQVKGSEKEISGQIDLKKAEAVFAQTGKFTDVAGNFKGQGRLDGKQGEGALEFAGKLNGEPFETHTVLAQTPARITVGLKATAERLILPTALTSSDKKTSQETQAAAGSPWSLPPMDINADVQIGSLDIPYLNGHDLRFKTDLTGVTPQLNQTHGKFDFSIGNGTITDLYQLTNSNPLAKVLFLSLSVVGKVFNSLDVLSVLGGLAGGGKDSATGEEIVQMIPGEDGELVAIKVPAKSRKVEGSLAYDKFITRIDFDEGFATVEEGHFVSNMMSFKLSGTTDFNTEKIDMTVKAAPGKHETDGIMPLTLKIGGTVSNPKGSMSVMRSVTSLVTQGVANNFASRAVKNTVGGVFGIFKKKGKEETQEATPQTQEPSALPVEGENIPAETTEAVVEP